MSDRKIEEVKSRNPIEQVVGRYVKLSFRGTKATGLCPFHDDHHPSLQVDIRKQTFVCYACGEKGDVIEFVKRKEGCGFPEALEKLGYIPEKKHLRAIPDMGPLSAPLPQRPEPVPDYAVREEHAGFLRQLMPYIADHPELSSAYLDFEVGLAPQSIRHPMRGRLIFPVRDETGELKGFSGREDAARPTGAKYLNTPSAKGFYRSRILYGLHQAKGAMEQYRCLYLVEGYKDVIAMHAAGFTHTAGICGTELTEEQIALFLPDVEQVFLVMDRDEAGRQAAEKIREKLQPLQTDIILLPDGHDPDSLFRELGKEPFAEYIQRRSLLLHRWEYLLVTACMLWPEAKVRHDGEYHPFLSLLPEFFRSGEITCFFRDHERIIEHLNRGESREAFPQELQPIAKELTERYATELEQMFGEWLEVREGDAAKAVADLMQYLLFHYSEGVLTDRMNGLIYRFRRSQNAGERTQLLHAIDGHRDLLRFVSEKLCRPAALEEWWARMKVCRGSAS